MSHFKKALIALSMLVVAGCESSSPTAVGSIRIEPPNTSIEPGQSAQLVVIAESGETVTDGVKRANELATFLGFSLIQVSQDGFSATLKPKQASAVSCEPDVASMTYL